ncbi:MAG: spermidine/putrescine ABC transporter substrate-binding protein [Xanthomonadales bacterium]|nr:spermidine/putrescine ABC transporter substrate-binding protein [Xanthomonadales bacterium]
MLLFVAAMAAAPCWAVAESKSLVFLNWSDYLDPGVEKEFEQTAGVQLKTIAYSNDYDRDRILVETDAKGFDLGIVDGASLRLYARLGWIDRLDVSRLPNLKHVDRRWRRAYAASEEFALPYFWGTTGIGYRPDLVGNPPATWRDVVQPDQTVCALKIMMTNDYVDLVGVGLLAAGFQYDSADHLELRAAHHLLLRQKPCVYQYDNQNLNENGTLVTGDVALAMMDNGDFKALHEIDPSIQYVLPEDGALFWVDYLVVFSESKNKDLAHQFIDFLNTPVVAARNAEGLGYAPANRSALSHLPLSVLADPIIFPSANDIDRRVMETELNSRAMRARSRIYAEVTGHPQ